MENVTVNFGIVRGLDYYSGVVFEAFDTNSDVGALVGGGRYDSLPRAFGRDDIGATGVAGGVERILLSLESQGRPSQIPAGQVAVLFVNEEMHKTAIRIASRLRELDIAAEIDLVGRSFKKQMENAGQSRFSVIVAPKELSEEKVVIKSMADGKEQQASLESFLESPKSYLTL